MPSPPPPTTVTLIPPLLAALLAPTELTTGASSLTARLTLPYCRSDDTPTRPSVSRPDALRHTSPLSLNHTLPAHAVQPTRALLLAPLDPALPRPTTLTIVPPLQAVLLAPAELTLGAS